MQLSHFLPKIDIWEIAQIPISYEDGTVYADDTEILNVKDLLFKGIKFVFIGNKILSANCDTYLSIVTVFGVV